jgi:hypothetical protein
MSTPASLRPGPARRRAARGRWATSARCAAPVGRRVQRVGQRHAHGQRQARPLPGASGRASEKVSEAPSADCQARPRRPRPRVWCSATSRQGGRPGAGRRRAGASASARAGRRSTRVGRLGRRQHLHAQARQQRLQRCHSASAPQADACGPSSSAQRLGASMVPRQSGLPQRQAYSFFSLGVSARRSPGRSRRTALRRAHVAQRLDEDPAVDSSASQLGSQAWLIQRDALPPTLASMTCSSSTWK